MGLVLRYFLYFGFVFAAIFFWMLCLGLSMGEPACLAEGFPCPKPGFWEAAARRALVFGAIPLTAIAFIFFRRGVRRMLGLE